MEITCLNLFVVIIFYLFFAFFSMTSSVQLPFTLNLREIWGVGLYPSSFWGRERQEYAIGCLSNTHVNLHQVVSMCPETLRAPHTKLYTLMHSGCFCTLFSAIYQSDFGSCRFKKVKDNVCKANYNKLYVSPHMSFPSADIHHTLV